MTRQAPPLIVALAVLGLAVACASAPRATAVQAPLTAPALAPAPTPPAAADREPDLVAELIARSEAQFEAGQRDLALGHLGRARVAFDGAVDSLLESPESAHVDPRLRRQLDSLVDRITVLEQTAVSAGDGFTAAATAPAVIDTLLDIAPADDTPPALATAEIVAADLSATAHDIPIPANARVLKYVEVFQGRLREFLTEGLSRGSQYLPMIQEVFRNEGLPLDLAYVPLVESAFKATALSRTKARGVWQFMPGTGRENGLKSDWYLDERADTVKATAAAAKYLKTLYGLFEDWHLAMASYNGGPGRLQRAIKRSRKTTFWELAASPRYLPRETREYVPMILAAVIIARNPAQYGFEVTPVEPPTFETVVVPHALDLRRVAEWAGVPIDDLQRINPEFRRWTTPIRAGEYTLRVPLDTAERVREGLRLAAPGSLNALQWYPVKKGDTLVTIARKLGVSRSDLTEANYLKRTARVVPGQKLVVPRMPSAALLARAAGGESVVAEASPPATAPSAPRAPAVTARGAAAASETTRTVYRVRSGDTLTAIAKRFGTTVDRVKAWNRLRSAKLNVGDRLVVMSPSVANTQQD